MTILGIDPGAHGAIAVLDEGGDLWGGGYCDPQAANGPLTC
jgi:hypothetical protein